MNIYDKEKNNLLNLSNLTHTVSRNKSSSEILPPLTHDLSGRLHVISFCVEELKEIIYKNECKYDKETMSIVNEYFLNLNINLKYFTALVEILKSRCKINQSNEYHDTTITTDLDFRR